jgi:quinol monooxygenase YgiN
MLLIVGTIRLPAENLPQARPAMQRVVEASNAESGCLHYGYAEDLFDPGLIHIKEMWADWPSLQAHAKAAHLAEWRAQGPGLGVHGRDLRLHEVGEGQPV